MIAGRRAEKAESLAAKLASRGLMANSIAMDANSVDSIQDAVDGVAGRLGRIDLLINCIGIHKEQSLLDVTEDVYDEVYRVNLKSAMFLAQATARHQIAAGKGGGGRFTWHRFVRNSVFVTAGIRHIAAAKEDW